MDRGFLYQFLRSQRYGVISSIAAGNCSQSALVGIAVTSDLEILFDTVKTSRKYRNLKDQPLCSFVVGWEGERTVQYEGVAFEPTGTELQRFQSIYFSAWPDGRRRMSWPDIVYLVVRPRWIRYSDFSLAEPQIEETSFG
jgi:hypothetical protein